MFLPVDDDRRDLLVHEDENGTEQRGDEGDDGGPPGVGPHWVYNPATIVPGWLQTMSTTDSFSGGGGCSYGELIPLYFYFQLFNQTYFEFVWDL